jgi:membrane protein YdbS with pleckstrin-like domain
MGRMTDLRLRAPANLVSARARWFWAVRALAGWLVVLAIETIVWLLAPGATAAHVLVLAGTLVLAGAHLAVMPQWRYRVHRWETTDTAVYTQSGWFRQERRIAPIVRLQTVDVHRGPFEQLFGLANVTVTTASAAGPLEVHALDLATAEALVHELTARAQLGAEDGT